MKLNRPNLFYVLIICRIDYCTDTNFLSLQLATGAIAPQTEISITCDYFEDFVNPVFAVAFVQYVLLSLLPIVTCGR